MATATLKVNADITELMAQLDNINKQLSGLKEQNKDLNNTIDKGFKDNSNAVNQYVNDLNNAETELKQQKQIIAEMKAAENQLKVARRQSNDPKEIAKYDKELKRLAQDLAIAKKEQVQLTSAVNQKKEALKKSTAELKRHEEAAKKSQTSNNNLTRSFSSLARGLGITFSLAAFTALLKQGVTLAMEAEKANKRLEFSLKGTGVSYSNMINLAKEMEDKLAISDEVFKNQIAFLALQGRTEEQIKKVIKTAADMSAVTGEDLNTSIKKLDSTFEGQLGTLSKMDSSLKNLTKEQLANGEAIDILSEKYAGFAEQGVTGLDRLRKDWNNFLENLGTGAGLLYDILTGVNVTRNAALKAHQQLQDEWAAEEKKYLEDLKQSYIKETKSFGDNVEKRDKFIRKLFYNAKGYITDFNMTYEDFVKFLNAKKDFIQKPDEKILTAYEELTKQLQDLNKEYENQIFLNSPLAFATGQRIKEIEKEIETTKTLAKGLKNFTFEEDVIIEPDILINPKDFEVKKEAGIELSEQMLNSIFGEPPDAEDIFTPTWQMEFAVSINKIFGVTLFKNLDHFERFVEGMKGLLSLGLSEVSDFMSIEVEQWSNVLSNIQGQISETEKKLEEEQQKQKEGFANNVKLEQQRLDMLKAKQKEAEAMQQEALNRQRTVDSITQSINMATAISGILKDLGATGVVGLALAPALIAALLVLFKNSKQKAADAAKYEQGGYGVLGGKRHSDGGTYVPYIGEVEQGEFFGIINRKQTQKYQSGLAPLIDGINSNDNRKLIRGLNEIALRANLKSMQGGGVNKVDINSKVSLNEISDIKKIRELMENGVSVTYTDGYRIEKKGNITKRIKMN